MIRILALSGAQAPHRPAGQVFQLLDGVPGGSFIDPPTIDALGSVGFGANLSNVVNPPPFDQPFAASRWKATAADIIPLAVNGDPAPGIDGDLFLPSLGIDVPSLAGVGAFTSFVGAFDPLVAFTDARGAVEPVAVSGTQPPGLAAGNTFFQLQDFAAESSDVIVFGTYATDGVTLPDNQGLWKWHDGTLSLRYAKGTHAPGMASGVMFSETAITPTRSFGELRVGSDSRLIFVGWTHGPGVTAANDEGVWLEDGSGSASLIAREGSLTPAAGTGFRYAAGLDSFETFGGRASSPPPMVSIGGAIYGAALKRGSDVVASVWAKHPGTAPELLARTAAPANDPGAPTPPGFPAGSRYLTLPFALVDQGGTVLYRAVVTKPGGAQEAAAWSVAPRGFPLLTVRGNLPLPDGGTIESFFFLGVNRMGHFAVVGRAGDLSRNVVLLCDFGGAVTQLIAPGDAVEVAPGDTRTVATLEAGPGLSDAGAVAVRLTFTDGSVAIASVVLGTACITDFNRDGIVNSTDVSDFLNAWFDDVDHGMKGSFLADFNNDFVVNSTDVSDFINAWFEDLAAGCGD